MMPRITIFAQMKKILTYVLAILALVSCSTMREYRKVPIRAIPTSLDNPIFDSIQPAWRTLARQLTVDGGLPPVSGNQAQIFTDGLAKFHTLFEDMENARFAIDVEVYRFADDSIATVFRDILLRKAAQGVVVRVLLEGRAYPSGKPSFYEALREAENIYVLDIQPGNDLGGLIAHLDTWDHRKFIVIDNQVGYVGGMNIQDKYFDEWRDTHVRVEGPGARDMREYFDAMWAMLAGTEPSHYPLPEAAPEKPGVMIQLVGDGPATPENPIEESYETALAATQDYFYIQTPYFCPPPSLIRALKDAAARGVDVRIMLPEKNDVFFMEPVNESFFRDLLKAGVRIYLRGTNFIHTKAFVCDDYLSGIGSANLDYRSLRINFEDNCYFYDEAVARHNKEIFFQDLELCQEITLDNYHPTLWQYLGQGFFRLFAPLI